jgi:hypothetical protein
VNFTSKLWNKLRLGQSSGSPGLLALPELKLAATHEKFGLVSSEHAATFGGLFPADVKEDPKVEDNLFTLDADEEHDENIESERLRLLDELNIDPHLLAMPLVQHSPAPALNQPRASSPSPNVTLAHRASRSDSVSEVVPAAIVSSDSPLFPQH